MTIEDHSHTLVVPPWSEESVRWVNAQPKGLNYIIMSWDQSSKLVGLRPIAADMKEEEREGE